MFTIDRRTLAHAVISRFDHLLLIVCGWSDVLRSRSGACTVNGDNAITSDGDHFRVLHQVGLAPGVEPHPRGGDDAIAHTLRRRRDRLPAVATVEELLGGVDVGLSAGQLQVSARVDLAEGEVGRKHIEKRGGIESRVRLSVPAGDLDLQRHAGERSARARARTALLQDAARPF